MIRTIFPVFLALVVLVLSALIFTLPTPNDKVVNTWSDASEFVIKNAKPADKNANTESLKIHIKDGYIEALGSDIEIPQDVEVFDGKGLTVLPGLIDSHTHSYGAALEDALRFGVTVQLDMFSNPATLLTTRAAREVGKNTDHADFFSAGMLATAAGGHGTQYGIPVDTLDGPAGAMEWVRQRKAQGSDFIKLVYMPGQTRIPSINRDTARALIDAAHANELLAVAHISTQAAARELIEDGIDGLVHMFADSVATPDLVSLAKSKNVFFIPTLVVIASVDGRGLGHELSGEDQVLPYLSSEQKQSLAQQFPGNVPGFSMDVALQNVQLLHQAGVDILAGSDAPNPGTAHGISLHQEMELLVQAGLSPVQALDAATGVPARRFSLKHRGELRAGGRADLVLVNGNPARDILSTRAIEHVMKNGRFVARQQAVGARAEPLDGNVLGDFDSKELIHGQFEWSPTTDVMAGGKSDAQLSIVSAGEGGSAYALQIIVEVKSGFNYPWAGASVTPSQEQSAKDVSRFTGISFSVKGSPGQYRLMVFSGTGGGIPPMQNFEITEQWQRITLSLDDFAGFDPSSFIGFGFVAGPGLGKFDFLLDTIEFIE